MELLCPAGNLASLKSALQAGADAVYLGLKDDTNARSFAGLNFTPA
ncbi:MAG: ubiquinone anaerobic biosynthesis protein UbiU, partial [Shewanella sp.]